MARKGGRRTRRSRRGGDGCDRPTGGGPAPCGASGGGRGHHVAGGATHSTTGGTRRRRGGATGVLANAAVPVVLIALNEYFKNTKRGQTILDKLRKDARGVI